MDILESLWNYQTAELAYESFEDSLKNTDTRKKMVQYQKLFTSGQTVFKSLESESASLDKLLKDIIARAGELKTKITQKTQELLEMEGYDLEDLFIADVRESIKESERIKTALEQDKKKAVEAKKRLEAINEEAMRALRTMSAAKKKFDELKEQYNTELEASAGDIERLKKDIKEAAKDVEPDLLAKYKTIKARWKNPVARLNNDRCSGCNMQLPVSVLGKLKTAGAIVECDSCGRILYV